MVKIGKNEKIILGILDRELSLGGRELRDRYKNKVKQREEDETPYLGTYEKMYYYQSLDSLEEKGLIEKIKPSRNWIRRVNITQQGKDVWEEKNE